MSISASIVKQLRERTGAGMMECKKALVETEGDVEAAVDLMRKRGQAKAAKRAGKVAAEGRVTVALSQDQRCAMLVETNCETDFVARDKQFVAFSDLLTQQALQHHVTDVNALLALESGDGSHTLEQKREELVSKIGENIQVRRVAELKSDAHVGHYLHGDRIGVLVALNQDNAELARDLAMHIAAMKPLVVKPQDLPNEVLEREKQIIAEQVKDSGKPAEIIEKMIDGRVRKYLDEVSLHGQAFVKEPSKTIAELLQSHQAEVIDFVRFEVGEGIDKESVDFAEEVQSQVQASK